MKRNIVSTGPRDQTSYDESVDVLMHNSSRRAKTPPMPPRLPEGPIPPTAAKRSSSGTGHHTVAMERGTAAASALLASAHMKKKEEDRFGQGQSGRRIAWKSSFANGSTDDTRLPSPPLMPPSKAKIPSPIARAPFSEQDQWLQLQQEVARATDEARGALTAIASTSAPAASIGATARRRGLSIGVLQAEANAARAAVVRTNVASKAALARVRNAVGQSIQHAQRREVAAAAQAAVDAAEQCVQLGLDLDADEQSAIRACHELLSRSGGAAQESVTARTSDGQNKDAKPHTSTMQAFEQVSEDLDSIESGVPLSLKRAQERHQELVSGICGTAARLTARARLRGALKVSAGTDAAGANSSPASALI